MRLSDIKLSIKDSCLLELLGCQEAAVYLGIMTPYLPVFRWDLVTKIWPEEGILCWLDINTQADTGRHVLDLSKSLNESL